MKDGKKAERIGRLVSADPQFRHCSCFSPRLGGKFI
jgi:hypothetical protein